MADSAISTEDLRKTYGRSRGLAGLDLQVKTGEVYGYLGPNGAGKSTTIRILLDLIRPTSGRVSGLDPLLQQEFVQLVREAKGRGATVFMSSHVMSEVQQTADRVGIIRDGRLVTVQSVESLREHAVRSVTMTFGGEFDSGAFTRLPGFTDVTVDGATVRGRLSGHADELIKAASRYPVLDLLCEEPDLEDIFFHFYAGEAGRVAA